MREATAKKTNSVYRITRNIQTSGTQQIRKNEFPLPFSKNEKLYFDPFSDRDIILSTSSR